MESSSVKVIVLSLVMIQFILQLYIKTPTKYFTPEILQALDECAAKEFSYGS